MVKFLAGSVLAAVLGFGAWALAPAAGAWPDPDLGPSCDTTPTGSLIDQRGFRTICDGPIEADGSWQRKNYLWGESNRVCTRGTLGNRRCMDMPGGVHIYTDPDASYRVTPDAIPFGEPGHLG